MRRALSFAGLASALAAGIALYRHRLGGRRGRLDVYLEDGSFVTYVEGSPEADRMLPLARKVLATSRGT